MLPVVLASASKARTLILQNIGLPHIVHPSTVNEPSIDVRTPIERARTLAMLKAEEVSEIHPHAIVIGVDTLVEAANGEILEKPADANDALRMLQLYNNSYCLVHTGLTVYVPNKPMRVCVTTSRINFMEFSESLCTHWLQKNHWQYSAGALCVEKADVFIDSIVGDYASIIGLSVSSLQRLLKLSDIDLTDLLT